MSLSVITDVTDCGREDTWEFDGVRLEPNAAWASFAPTVPPQALTLDAIRRAVRNMHANSGRAPDRVVVSQAQLDAISDSMASDVTRTVAEE